VSIPLDRFLVNILDRNVHADFVKIQDGEPADVDSDALGDAAAVVFALLLRVELDQRRDYRAFDQKCADVSKRASVVGGWGAVCSRPAPGLANDSLSPPCPSPDRLDEAREDYSMEWL